MAIFFKFMYRQDCYLKCWNVSEDKKMLTVLRLTITWILLME